MNTDPDRNSTSDHAEDTTVSSVLLRTRLRTLLRTLLRSRWDDASRAWIDEQLSTAPDFDWKALLESARQTRVSPLLHQALHDRTWIPAEIRHALRMDLFQVTRQNMIALHSLAAVLDGFTTAGIPHIVLKGAALALTLYQSEGLRPMCDIDLLVPQDKVRDAIQVLQDSGYTMPIPEIHNGARLLYNNELFFQHPQPEYPHLDLHVYLFSVPHLYHSIPAQAVWETAHPLPVLEIPSQCLSLENTLLHLAGHLVLHHHTPEDLDLLWSHDLAFFLTEHSRTLAWDTVCARAQAWNLVVPVQRVLTALTRDWCVPIPEDVLQAVARLQPSRAEARIIRWRASGRQRTGIQSLLHSTGTLPGTQRLRYLLRQAFPTVRYMRENYGMPHPVLLPVYYGYRWLRGLGWVR